jgi:hypothetical protein
MAFPNLHPRILLALSLLAPFTCPMPAPAQFFHSSIVDLFRSSTAVTDSTLTDSSSLSGPGNDLGVNSEVAGPPLPEAPEPAAPEGSRERYNVAPAGEQHQAPFSRIGIGADVSPLGIGIKSAIILSGYFDARLMGNFFQYNSGRYEVEGFNVTGNLHLASAAASLDWYPFNSVWRLSPGVIFFNGNQISMATAIVPGTSFTLNNQTFYSASANPVTGATPLAGTGVLGLNTNRPAATITGGFGKFIPRSNRHWSFPAEFGVAFTGAPSANVNASGWVCLDAAQTQCSNLGDSKNPVAIEFNSALQTSLTKWRKSLSLVQVYPIFSYSVVYSFNIR